MRRMNKPHCLLGLPAATDTQSSLGLRGYLGILSALFVGGASVAFGGETRLGMDPSANLDQLRVSHEIRVLTGREPGDVFTADASGVLNAVPSRLESIVLDFDRQAGLHMPDTVEMQSVARSADDAVVWMHMEAPGIHSRHFLDFHTIHADASEPRVWQVAWQLVHAQSGWMQTEAPAFSQFDGSLYVLPLGDGAADALQPIYVRYFMALRVESSVPAWLLAGFLKNHMGSDVRKGLQIFEAQSQKE